MNKRVLSMLTVGAMTASTLLSSVPAFAAETAQSGYVLMNIPYSVFYAAQGSDIEVDAVSAATGKINSTALAKGGYADADNNIKGATVPVYVADLSSLTGTEIDDDDTLEVSWTARGQQNTDTLEGREVLLKSGDYAYYVLGDDEAPAVYAVLGEDGKSISQLQGGTSSDKTAAAEMGDGANAHHTTYEISGVEFTDTIYGLVLNTEDGDKYALRHISGIWRNLEYGFDAASFDGAAGKNIVGMTVYTSAGTQNVTFEEELPIKETVSDQVNAEISVVDANTIKVSGLPSGIENAKATVSYKVTGANGRPQSVAVAEDVVIENGKIVLEDALEDGVTYYVTVTSDNYVAYAVAEGVTYEAPAVDPDDGKDDTDETPSDDKKDDGADDNKGTDETPSDDKKDDVVDDKTTDNATTEEVKEEKSSSKHTHNYEWVTSKKATATTDGLMKYRCKKCGKVEYEVPTSAYYVFNKETQEAVKNAAAGATVTVETPIFISFHEMVKEALVERADVTLVVDYKNAGKSYEMTIPAGSGATLETLFGQDRFAGFLYLGGSFATVEK